MKNFFDYLVFLLGVVMIMVACFSNSFDPSHNGASAMGGGGFILCVGSYIANLNKND